MINPRYCHDARGRHDARGTARGYRLHTLPNMLHRYRNRYPARGGREAESSEDALDTCLFDTIVLRLRLAHNVTLASRQQLCDYTLWIYDK